MISIQRLAQTWLLVGVTCCSAGAFSPRMPLISSLFPKSENVRRSWNLCPYSASSPRTYGYHAFNSGLGVTMTSRTGGGGGMGMGSVSGPSKKKKNQKKKKSSSTGTSSSSSSSSSFDVNASLLRLEKQHDDLSRAFAKQSAREMAQEEDDPRWASAMSDAKNGKEEEATVLLEYIIAVRSKEQAAATSLTAPLSDWIPVAQLVLARPIQVLEQDNNGPKENHFLHAVVSYYCRELFHSATLAAPIVAKVPRNDVEYSIETIDSFFRFVHDPVIENRNGNSKSSGGSKKEDDNAENFMTKAQAREVLGLTTPETEADIKQAYRKLMFKLHPDRYTADKDENAVDTSNNMQQREKEFDSVRLAYETLTSGIRQDGISWYESLGGRRNSHREFFGPVPLCSMAQAKERLISPEEKENVIDGKKVGIIGMTRDIVQSFVTRNLRSE